MWREFFRERFTVKDGMLICSADYLEHGECYSMPVGTGSLENALEAIRSHCTESGMPLQFCCITEEGVKALAQVLGAPAEVVPFRDWADYIYPYSNFMGYHGKKLVTQRNHCNRFIKEHPQYEYKPILSADDAAAAKHFLLSSAPSFAKEAPLAKEEYVRAVEAMDHFFEFGFTGGLLSVDGRTIGLSVGEVVGDTLYVHVEKALKEYGGAYPMLASLYAKQNASKDILFINREDDSGDPGLRYSKLEYRPSDIIVKYVVRF